MKRVLLAAAMCASMAMTYAQQEIRLYNTCGTWRESFYRWLKFNKLD